MWQLAIKEMKWRSFVPRFSEDVRNVLKIMVPAALAAGIGPINVTINTNFATSAGEGAVTWLNYAFRLLQMPIGVFGVAIASAALPAMTRAIAKAGNRVDDAAARELQSALELVLWLMVPCMLILICNSLPMIRLLFQHARFTSEDATATAVALSAYSYGIIGYGMAKVLTAFYFALERTKFALIVGVISIMVNLVGNSILVERFGHVGLAMTSSVSLSINALVLLIGLSHSQIQWNRLNLLKTFGFLAVGGALSYYLQESILEALSNSNWLHHYNYKIESLIQIALNGLFVCTVFAMLAMFRLKIGPTTLWRIIKSRGRRK
jgi:putative peptidoglycan lipid II flippase